MGVHIEFEFTAAHSTLNGFRFTAQKYRVRPPTISKSLLKNSDFKKIRNYILKSDSNRNQIYLSTQPMHSIFSSFHHPPIVFVHFHNFKSANKYAAHGVWIHICIYCLDPLSLLSSRHDTLPTLIEFATRHFVACMKFRFKFYVTLLHPIRQSFASICVAPRMCICCAANRLSLCICYRNIIDIYI